MPPNLPQLPEVLLLGCISSSKKLIVTSSKVIDPSFKFGLTSSEILEVELLFDADDGV